MIRFLYAKYYCLIHVIPPGKAPDTGTFGIKGCQAEITGLFEGCSAKLRMDVANNSDVEVAEALAPALLSGRGDE